MEKFLITTVSVGQEADSIGKSSLPLLKLYAKKCKADFGIIGSSKNAKADLAFYEKLQVRDLLNSYNKVLFIDLDVLVSPLSPNIFGMVTEDVFAATSVESVLPSINREKEMITDCLGPVDWKSPYFNSGVMLFGQSSKPMLEYAQNKANLWIKYKKTNNLKAFNDQTLLNYALSHSGPLFFDLGKSFNFTRAWKFFHTRFSQNFIHYAGLRGNRDWQMKRDYKIFTSSLRFPLHRFSPRYTWLTDRLHARLYAIGRR